MSRVPVMAGGHASAAEGGLVALTGRYVAYSVVVVVNASSLMTTVSCWLPPDGTPNCTLSLTFAPAGAARTTAAPTTAARTCDTRTDRPTTGQGTPVRDARASRGRTRCPFRGSPFVYDATTPPHQGAHREVHAADPPGRHPHPARRGGLGEPVRGRAEAGL